VIDIEKMKALAADLRKASGGRYKWYAMGRDESSYFMDFDWGYDADRWFNDQQKSRAAWIEQEGVHIVKKLFQTELETNAADAATAIESLLSELEAREADRRDADRYRGLFDALHCGDIPMKESSISLNVCGVPPDRDEFDEAVDFSLAQRQEGEEK